MRVRGRRTARRTSRPRGSARPRAGPRTEASLFLPRGRKGKGTSPERATVENTEARSQSTRMWSPNGSTTLDRVDGPLTEREREVLRLLALGYTNREVAERLVLSVRTIESHRENIQRKLGVRSRAELTN